MTESTRSDRISIRGARQNNLKNVDVDVPKGQLVVFSGVSGSGKSSLALDIIYAEGQRRYIASLSAHARHFMQQLERPSVDAISGLSPTVAIGQQGLSTHSRITVGTATEIHDHLSILYARFGAVHCPGCNRVLKARTVDEIVSDIVDFPVGSRVSLLAPINLEGSESLTDVFQTVQRDGFIRVRINGQVVLVEEAFESCESVDRLEVVVDRIKTGPDVTSRVRDSVETGLRVGQGTLIAQVQGEAGEHVFSQGYTCLSCKRELPDVSPDTFSFRKPQGMCPSCQGLGFQLNSEVVSEATSRESASRLEEVATSPCPDCGGGRLNEVSGWVRLGGLTLPEANALPLTQLRARLANIEPEGPAASVGREILHEVAHRLGFLDDVGLGYLSLGRATSTLSSGESQRIRLSRQMGSELTGLTYVLDEPSAGLHSGDIERLLEALKRLRDLGNSVLVVEHEASIIRAADYLIDFGLGAGQHGGEVVAAGIPERVMTDRQSLTAAYLRGERSVPRSQDLRQPNRWMKIEGASLHNLDDLNVEIPLGVFCTIAGVSGAGKSTLINRVLVPSLRNALNDESRHSFCRNLSGHESVRQVMTIDQTPLSGNLRSNAATYTQLYGEIRKIFAQTRDAATQGYKAGRFSFNNVGGRCEVCQGVGAVKVELHLMPDAQVTCSACNGRRFNEGTLAVRFKGLDISEVLALSVAEAYELLRNFPRCRKSLQALKDVGLGYLPIGRPANTLSGGESQRIKLARELAKQAVKNTLYVFDEPTSGLHFDDVARLLRVFQGLVDKGHSVLVVEHHLDVIMASDYVLELGPEAGPRGGKLIFHGTPLMLAKSEASPTGRALRYTQHLVG